MDVLEYKRNYQLLCHSHDNCNGCIFEKFGECEEVEAITEEKVKLLDKWIKDQKKKGQKFMRYFEIEFDNVPRNQDGSEEDVSGEYSICILGESKPTIQEAAEFCKSDMEQMGYKYVVNVREVDEHEAHTFFDMEKEDDFPVFAKGTDYIKLVQ